MKKGGGTFTRVDFSLDMGVWDKTDHLHICRHTSCRNDFHNFFFQKQNSFQNPPCDLKKLQSIVKKYLGQFIDWISEKNIFGQKEFFFEKHAHFWTWTPYGAFTNRNSPYLLKCWKKVENWLVRVKIPLQKSLLLLYNVPKLFYEVLINPK